MPEEPIIDTETEVVENFAEPEAGIMPVAEEDGVMSTAGAPTISGGHGGWEW